MVTSSSTPPLPPRVRRALTAINEATLQLCPGRTPGEREVRAEALQQCRRLGLETEMAIDGSEPPTEEVAHPLAPQ